MSKEARRRNVVIVLVLLIVAAVLLLVRCRREETGVTPATAAQELSETTKPAISQTSEPAEPKTKEAEVLTPATLQGPAEIGAGAVFSVNWTGPANPRDYITIVKRDAPDGAYANYRDTKDGNPLELTAPIEAGEWELRYMTFESRAVLGRAPIEVVAQEATLDAPQDAVLGTVVDVKWTGPSNAQDYVTVVAKGAPDGRYGNYTETKKGSPLKLTMPAEAGEWEIRYVTGQGAKVLARRDIQVIAPEITLSAPEEVVAGSAVNVEWAGPDNSQDYITLVPKGTKDGQYGNYTETRKGSPMQVRAPIMEGEAELRYMSGQGAKVLARRAIDIVPAKITLEASDEVTAGEKLEVTWTGPNHPGDYITLVPANLPEGQYRAYVDTRRGSPLRIEAPKEVGEAELRYVSGQGAKTLARRAVRVE
jgi:Ca-activated chloride channel family protein